MTYLRHPGPSGPQIEPMPSSIVQAICQVMASMQAVKKSAKNPHGGYSYASADDTYAACVIRMAEAGLIINVLEAEPPEIIKSDKGAQWARVTFQFVLATAEATWTDTSCRRTILLPVDGPQAFMAAQSYAEKSYLRSLFKIPTGDMELDEIYTMQDEERRPASSAAAKRAGVWDQVQELIQQADDLSELAQIDTEWRSKLPSKWRDPFSDLLASRNQEILARM